MKKRSGLTKIYHVIVLKFRITHLEDITIINVYELDNKASNIIKIMAQFREKYKIL